MRVQYRVDVPPESDVSDRLDHDTQRETVLVLELWEDGCGRSLVMVSFLPSKHLERPTAHISFDTDEVNREMRISLNSDSTARFVMLEVTGHSVRFGDNFFDLPAGRTVGVTVIRPDGLSMEELASKLRIISLRDSY